MAKLWTDSIRETYRNKNNDGTPNKPIVQTTATELVKPIDNLFGQNINYDSPDLVMREVLKKNVWDFSVAKNYNDNIRLNNLLLDDEGKLRSWSDFKYEAQKVVGDSNRYLKTEHNTVVAGAQMSRLWMEIQRDKAIFPLAQFDIVDDDRLSDICKPLKDVIVKVDDPMLAYYFPPNHFNCRTTVRKLRNGTPTETYELPEVPKEFQNNVGKDAEIFTQENAYIKEASKEAMEEADRLFFEDMKRRVIEKAQQDFVGKQFKTADNRMVMVMMTAIIRFLEEPHKNKLEKNSLGFVLDQALKKATKVKTKKSKDKKLIYYKAKGKADLYIVVREKDGKTELYNIIEKL